MKKSKKIIVMMASIILAFAVTVSGTIAWLFTSTNEVVNTFTPTEVPNKVVETFDGTTKTRVAIKNEGNIDAYVRAAVVATWAEVDANGEPTGNVYSEKPALNMSPLGEDWKKGADGYYYYTKKLSPKDTANDTTSVMFESIALADGQIAPEGYVLSVEIMGQTIQADGMNSTTNKTPVQEAWGVIIDETAGTVTAVS